MLLLLVFFVEDLFDRFVELKGDSTNFAETTSLLNKDSERIYQFSFILTGTFADDFSGQESLILK